MGGGMKKKLSMLIFILCFLLMLLIPLIGLLVQKETVSMEENRRLAEPAVLVDEAGKINPAFPAEFDTWVSDHVGFRKYFVLQSGRLHYALFRKFPLGNPNVFGPSGELNYATEDTFHDYQHKDLYPESYMRKVADALCSLSAYATEHGAKLYYYQCWDKQSVYPEQFPDTVLQLGKESKTDRLVQCYADAGVSVISPKQTLIEGKKRYETYSVFSDPNHWTPRGAYLGYLELMQALNRDSDVPLRVLKESDYKIKVKDLGYTLYGAIHRVNMLEEFTLRDPKAKLTNEKLSVGAAHPRSRYFTNDAVKNGKKLLIIGDSYFHEFILEDIAESFSETVLIWGDDVEQFKAAVDAYQPDLIVLENAEREDRTALLLSAASNLPSPFFSR